jgi:hypothetical protein
MKKSFAFSFVILLIILSCNNSFDSDSGNRMDNTMNAESQINKELDLRSTLLNGVWCLSDDQMVSFEIMTDSIYYPDQGEKYLYRAKGDSVFIYYDGWTYKGKYKFEAEYLMISDSFNVSTYIRRN